MCVAVVPEASGAGATLVPSGVHAFAAEVLAPYKRPKDVVLVDEIPRTATGKVRRSTLGRDLGLR